MKLYIMKIENQLYVNMVVIGLDRTGKRFCVMTI